MAGSRIQVNKAHKTRFASKATRQLHKTNARDKARIGKSERNVGRAARIQRSKMSRDQKRAALLKEKRAASGSSSPPRVIVLFGLNASVDIKGLAEELLALLSPEDSKTSTTVASPDYKLRATVLEAPHGDLLTCMQMAKVADLIAFVVSANTLCQEGSSSSYIDSFGTQCLSVFKALGLPNTVVLIRGLPVELKKRNDMKKMCMSSLASEFPEDSKFFPAGTKDELHKFMWLFKEQRLTIPHWRSHRPYIVAQAVDLVVDEATPGVCSLLLSGYVRAHNLSVNQLVHVSGAGDFQLCKIDVLKDPCPLSARKEDLMDSDELHDVQIIRSLVPDPLKQEPLLVENVPDPLAGEQTWPTEAEMTEAAEFQIQKKLKKKSLPRGTSTYQAAWIVDETDEEDSDSGDDRDDEMLLEGENGISGHECDNRSDFDEDQASLNLRDSDGETEADTMMGDDDDLSREQIQDEIRKIKEAHAEDEEFPDEVDTPIDVAARKRFAKYRGLKSFRTSSWDPKESLPLEYARIFAFDNFARTQKHVLAKALEMEQNIDECVQVGSYARLHIKEVPIDSASKLCSQAKASPVLACGLMQHESKMSVLHFSVKKHDTYSAPIKTKESLIFHVGFRQFVARPIFSSDSINSDKHKMERFLHAGRFGIASVYAPVSFPPLPLIVLKSGDEELAQPAVAAVGSLRSIDPDRIILKKIILTGYPQRVSKLRATVRYMFHTPEDVRWFKPVEVWTKCGHRGRVKEPVGTHGAMKCVFNGVVQQHDTVCMSLFKRAYPKWPERFPGLDA